MDITTESLESYLTSIHSEDNSPVVPIEHPGELRRYLFGIAFTLYEQRYVTRQHRCLSRDLIYYVTQLGFDFEQLLDKLPDEDASVQEKFAYEGLVYQLQTLIDTYGRWNICHVNHVAKTFHYVRDIKNDLLKLNQENINLADIAADAIKTFGLLLTMYDFDENMRTHINHHIAELNRLK